MATKKKATSTRNNKTTSKNSSAKKKASAKKQEPDYRWSILLFALGILFIAFSFIPGESAWAAVRENFLFGVFGICGWLLGPLLLYYAVLVGFGKPVGGAVLKGVFFVLALSGAALVFGKEDFVGVAFGDVVKSLFTTAQTSHFTGGVISIVLGYSLLKLCGVLAARILLVIIVIIALMLFSGVTPADITKFVKTKTDTAVENRRLRMEEEYEDEEYYEEEYEEEYEEPQIKQAVYKAPKEKKSSFWKSKKQPDVDVDLGPDSITSEPGLAENDAVVIGEGGTFGMNPLHEKPVKKKDDVLLPFDPYSDRSLLDGADEEQPNILLINEMENMRLNTNRVDTNPYASPYSNNVSKENVVQDDIYSAGVQHNVFTENVPRSSCSQFEKIEPAVSSKQEEPVAAGDGIVSDLIDKAAAKKVDNLGGGDTRPNDYAQTSYAYPPISLFEKIKENDDSGAKEEMHRTAELLTGTLESFGVKTNILDVTRGPSVTRYEIQPQKGVKISKITNLSDDIALNLAAAGVRIEAPIPGKPAVGIEVPNKIKSTVGIRSILENSAFTTSASPVSIALGKDIAGDCVVADLAKMPHLLIAGSTGSGKSVCVNATIMSFLYKSSPEDVKLILIDPKVVELAEYNGIPHLLMPVITEPRKAAGALGAAVAEMEKRYHMFAENNVRDIKTFNKLAERVDGLEKMPYIAIVIDELADLMMVAGKDVENYICRIAQKARAAGMHLIVATQRPSVDVITGLIKANIPSRIAFAVSSQIDSRTILDAAGAEKLLGMGDMLYMPVGANKPVRVQGTYVRDEEISSVLSYIKQHGTPQYDEGMIMQTDKMASDESAGETSADSDTSFMSDPTFVGAVELALDAGQVSTSNLQRRLRLGYARAGRIVDQMEQMGIVSGPNGSKPRDVLITRQDWLELSMNTDEKNRNTQEEF